MTCDRLPTAAQGCWTLWVRARKRPHWRIVTWHQSLPIVEIEEAKIAGNKYETLVLPSGEHPIEAPHNCHRPMEQ